MIIDREGRSSSAMPDEATLALAVLINRINTLPKEDREDLFEVTKAFYEAETQEEYDAAVRGMREILEQQKATVVRVAPTTEPGDELDGWISFVSSQIRTRRKAANLTQEQLEERTGLPQSHISRLENGEHSPSFVTLEKIAKALDIPVSVFDPCAP